MSLFFCKVTAGFKKVFYGRIVSLTMLLLFCNMGQVYAEEFFSLRNPLGTNMDRFKQVEDFIDLSDVEDADVEGEHVTMSAYNVGDIVIDEKGRHYGKGRVIGGDSNSLVVRFLDTEEIAIYSDSEALFDLSRIRNMANSENMIVYTETFHTIEGGIIECCGLEA